MSSFLQTLIDKGKGLLDFTEKAPTQTEAVKRNSFDRSDFNQVKDTAPAIQTMQAKLEQTVDYAGDFMADLHAGLFKVEPQVRDASEMTPTHVANRAVMKQLLDMPEMKELRQHSSGDVYGSAMAMVALQETAAETLHKVHAAAEEAAEKVQKQRKQHEDRRKEIEEMIEDLKKNPPPPPPPPAPPGTPGPGQPGQPGTPVDTRPGDLEKALDQFGPPPTNEEVEQAAQNAAEGFGKPLRNKAKQATEDLDAEQQLMQSFGVEPGTLERMDVRERMALAHRLANNRLAKFAKLLGQFKMVQQAESRKRVTNAASEVHGVTFGDNLTRMATQEFLNFADDSLEDLMWSRWAEQQLVVNDVRGKENQGQGPIICVVDESGSMTAEDVGGGSREAWSKALALALCDQAKRRKRDFIYIGFASVGEQYVIEFKGGNTPVEKVITMTEHFFNGGTHYETPLNMALDIVEKYAADGKAKPDIVFMTDDEYGGMNEAFMHHWNKVKDKTSLKCYGIAIGCSIGGALAAVSDNVREITELVNDPSNMGDVFRTI